MLKSNGLRHSKNLPVKFGFSPQIVPTNIAKKLPSKRCSQPLFNFSYKAIDEKHILLWEQIVRVI